MKLVERLWKAATYFLSAISFSPLPSHESQHPLLGGESGLALGYSNLGDGPVFAPPGRKGSEFKCEYPDMPGYHFCSTSDNRGCWLKNLKGDEYNINTDYEFIAPKGRIRKYTVEAVDYWVNADGLNFTEAKLFDKKYPGPWIEACWGDTIEVTVKNRLKQNGTSIHWHGIRQNLTNQMDGVNGVTQCPMAPEDSFVYTFKAVQYGTSWYHSHYSLQYADGLLGPLTIHGPSSANYDESIEPLLITDWIHISAFRAIYNPAGQNQTLLLNGRGNATRYSNGSYKADLHIPRTYTVDFDLPKIKEKPKRYLLRVINTSWASTMVFSIDNHMLQIVGADFVPIYPYFNTSVLVGIGQRYHVIVEAKPQEDKLKTNPIPDDGNFWIRTYIANNCPFSYDSTLGGESEYMKTGILRYNSSSRADPTSSPWTDVSLRCSDEEYKNMVPVVPWRIGPPINGQGNWFKDPKTFDVQLSFPTNGYPLFPLAHASLGGHGKFDPLRIDYSDPTLLHLNQVPNFRQSWVVVPANYTNEDWFYVVLQGKGGQTEAHPIHLHGHDFAIMQFAENTTFSEAILNLKRNNPPRRDVVLLPNNGFVIIAFKTDNPGSWLMHCHIADHASFGLALQILERQADANQLWPQNSSTINEINRVCANWNKWQGNCKNWAVDCKAGPFAFHDDSGI